MRNWVLGMLATLVATASFADTATYTDDTATLLNPERGFYMPVDLLAEADLSYVRDGGDTLVYTYVRLDEWNDRALPQSLLQQLDRKLIQIRRDSLKLVLRFSYNFPESDYQNAIDASMPTVLGHIRQLTPLLRKHSAVITVLQAGFIGAWGEWHSSSNNLDAPGPKQRIANALFAAMPRNRMVQFRYPPDLMRWSFEPLSAAAAWRNTNRARIAHHNDCFLSSDTDVGTYTEENIENEKAWLELHTPWVAVGGETCGAPAGSERVRCPTAVFEMDRFHWSFLNRGYNTNDHERWIEEGCFDDIEERLGYRYLLESSRVADSVAAGENLSVRVEMSNEGFATIYNLRPIEVVFQHEGTGAVHRVEVIRDARRWLPQKGETLTRNVSVSVPTDLGAGRYRVGLGLPDADSVLRSRPRYSLGFVNAGVFQQSSGVNWLDHSVSVTAPRPRCAGRPATIVGTTSNDVLNGTSGDDVIVGLGGNDLIRGFGGRDIICGGSGADRILGGTGNDLLVGGDGVDRIAGGDGNDVLRGDAGNDVLAGNAGADVLVGGSGADICNGGSGVDRSNPSCERQPMVP